MKYIEKGSLNTRLLLTILLLFASSLMVSTHEGGVSISHAKIVFASKRDSGTLEHVYVMEDNGRNVRRITDPNFYDAYPRWFPDGKRILFRRRLGRHFNSEFYIIDANGRNQRRFMENHPTDFYLVPSPDGKQVAFVSRRTGEWEIYTYHLESGQLRQLTNNFKADETSYRMDWSPDGRKLAYEHDTVGEGENIWIMNADGSRKHRLSPPDKGGITFLRRGAPVWSPSGKYIMYDESEGIMNKEREIEKIAERLVVQTVSTGVREVHKFSAKDIIITGSWMGNDQAVLLAIKRNWDAPTANYEIYRYNLVSRRLTNLTNHPSRDLNPHWISGTLAVFPGGKLTTLWGQLKQND